MIGAIMEPLFVIPVLVVLAVVLIWGAKRVQGQNKMRCTYPGCEEPPITKGDGLWMCEAHRQQSMLRPGLQRVGAQPLGVVGHKAPDTELEVETCPDANCGDDMVPIDGGPGVQAFRCRACGITVVTDEAIRRIIAYIWRREGSDRAIMVKNLETLLAAIYEDRQTPGDTTPRSG